MFKFIKEIGNLCYEGSKILKLASIILAIIILGIILSPIWIPICILCFILGVIKKLFYG